MQTIEMLKSLCQANGVSGAEENALAVAEQLCEGLGASTAPSTKVWSAR